MFNPIRSTRKFFCFQTKHHGRGGIEIYCCALSQKYCIFADCNSFTLNDLRITGVWRTRDKLEFAVGHREERDNDYYRRDINTSYFAQIRLSATFTQTLFFFLFFIPRLHGVLRCAKHFSSKREFLPAGRERASALSHASKRSWIARVTYERKVST